MQDFEHHQYHRSEEVSPGPAGASLLGLATAGAIGAATSSAAAWLGNNTPAGPDNAKAVAPMTPAVARPDNNAPAGPGVAEEAALNFDSSMTPQHLKSPFSCAPDSLLSVSQETQGSSETAATSRVRATVSQVCIFRVLGERLRCLIFV